MPKPSLCQTVSTSGSTQSSGQGLLDLYGSLQTAALVGVLQTAELISVGEFHRSAAEGLDDAGVEQQDVRHLGSQQDLNLVGERFAFFYSRAGQQARGGFFEGGVDITASVVAVRGCLLFGEEVTQVAGEQAQAPAEDVHIEGLLGEDLGNDHVEAGQFGRQRDAELVQPGLDPDGEGRS